MPAAPARFAFDPADPARAPAAAPAGYAAGAGRYDEGRGWGFEPGPGRVFSARVPPGRYRAWAAFRGGGDGSGALLVQGRRVALGAVPPAGGSAAFAVEVRDEALTPPRPNAPGGDRVLLSPAERRSRSWRGRLTVEALGAMPWPEAIGLEPAESTPALFLAGDSTVADQEEGPYASWGQVLPLFFSPGLVVANHARSGATAKSFLAELRLAKILDSLRPGDWLCIQFGHNDQKPDWPQTYADAASVFPAYLRAYAAEACARGATPILATSPERARFDSAGRIAPSHGDYPRAVRSLARETGAPLVDLEAMSRALYEALGPRGAAALLAAPAEGDLTHHGIYGAFELARCVASALSGSVPALAARLRPGAASFDPSRPDPAPDFAAAWPSP